MSRHSVDAPLKASDTRVGAFRYKSYINAGSATLWTNKEYFEMELCNIYYRIVQGFKQMNRQCN